MAAIQEVVKRLTIVSGEKGVDETASKLRNLAGAQGAVAVASEKTERATVALERRLATLQTRYDPAYAATRRLAEAENLLSAGRARGVVTAAREAEMLDLITAKHGQAAVAARGHASALAGLQGFAGGLGGGLLAGAGIAALTMLPMAMQRAIASVGDLADAATRAGVSAERLQIFRFAIQQTGGSAEDADAALTKFTVGLGRVGTVGGGPAASTLKALGISVKNASGELRNSEAVLADVINRLSQIENPAAVAGLAAGLFGKEAGPRMAALLMEGEAALQEYEKVLRETGSIMSNETVAQADKLDDRFKALTLRVSVLAKTLAVELGGALAGVVDNTDNLADFLNSTIDNPNWEALLRFLDPGLARRVLTPAAPSQPQLAGMGAGAAAGLKAQTVAMDEFAAATLAASEALRAGLVGETVKATELLEGRFSDAFGKATGSAKKLSEAVGDPMDLRPPIARSTQAVDELGDRFKVARGYVEDFASSLVSGLIRGDDLMGTLASSLDNVASALQQPGSSDLGALLYRSTPKPAAPLVANDNLDKKKERDRERDHHFEAA